MENPKTLRQAIEAGIREAPDLDSVPKTIEEHVKQFLSQKFTAPILREQTELKRIYKAIMGENEGP
jgi:3-methyladenine DNA glycosylase/8-oxoguanine DNA glycosylase